MKTLIIIALTCLSFVSTNAQLSLSGQDPSSLKWGKITTKHFKIIYPLTIQDLANEYAVKLENYYPYATKNLKTWKKKLPVIIHNNTVLSNGFVTWAPSRMEIITTPHQNMFAQNWLSQLAIHESRHVSQLNSYKSGMSVASSYIFGEVPTLINMVYTPSWFLEGDAVILETAVSKAGRGREPITAMEIKAIELEKKKRLSYDQAFFGTYRYNVPSHYDYGYLMMSEAYLNKNENITRTTLNKVGQFPITFVPFWLGLRKNHIKSKNYFYKETFTNLKKEWLVADTISSSGKSVKTLTNKYFTNDTYSKYINDSTIIASKSGIDDITRFVKISKGKESKIHTPGFGMTDKFDVSEKYIVWEEIKIDPRWENRTYSILKIKSVDKKGRAKKLTKKSRTFSPAICPDNQKIAAVEVDLNNKAYLVIIDINTRKEIARISHPDSEFLSEPAWLNNSQIAIIGQGEDYEKLWLTDINNQTWKCVFGPTAYNISTPKAWNNNILFGYTLDGTDNIYTLNTETGEAFKVTESRFGAHYPGVFKNTLTFSDYGSNGFSIREQELKQENFTKIEEVNAYKFETAEKLTEKFRITNLDTSKLTPNYKYKNYNKLFNSFRIHSWIPFIAPKFDSEIANSEDTPYMPMGFTVLSQNNLSTIHSAIGAYYDTLGFGHLNGELRILAWYPVITIGAEIGGTAKFEHITYLYPKPTNLDNYYAYWLEISQPLNYVLGKFQLYVEPYLKYIYRNYYWLDREKYFRNEGIYLNRGLDNFEAGMSLINQMRMSKRDIKPRWAQTLFISFDYPVKYPGHFNDNFVASSTFYFPGLFRHHSFYISAAYEKHLSRLNLPRGYYNFVPPADNYEKYSANYTLPLISPDLSLGPILYIKRLYANAYCDYAKGQGFKDDIITYGLEVSTEMHFMRFVFPFVPTVRISNIGNNYGDLNYEFYFAYSININNRGRSRVLDNYTKY